MNRTDLSSFERDPPRLIDGEDQIAELLQQEANRHPGPSPTFAGLRSARNGRQTARTLGLLLVALVPLVVIAVRPEAPSIPIAAEAPQAATAPTPAVNEPPRETKRAVTREDHQAVEATQSVQAPQPTSPEPERVARPQDSPARSPKRAAVNAVDCSAFSRKGDFVQALSCLEEASRTTGMSGELALLESARLRRHVTGNVSAALSDLQRYKSQFPNGALRREAGLLEIDVLRQLGQHEKARIRIAQLLPEVPEQRTELLHQQFDLDLTLSDCDAARATLEALGLRGEEKERLSSRLQLCRSVDAP